MLFGGEGWGALKKQLRTSQHMTLLTASLTAYHANRQTNVILHYIVTHVLIYRVNRMTTNLVPAGESYQPLIHGTVLVSFLSLKIW